MKPKIYPSVVSFESDWKKQFSDLKRLGVKEAGLFLTTLKRGERKEFYKSLEKSGIEFVPQVHIREDFTAEEALWLAKTYGVEYFTIHIFLLKEFSNWKLAKKLCVEYNPSEFFGENLKSLKLMDKVAGFCIGITHYYLAQRYHFNDNFKLINKLIKIYPIAINHLNGVSKKNNGEFSFDDMHFIKNMKEDFEHLSQMPKNLFVKDIFLEMSNSIEQQLEIRNYLYQNYFK